MSVCVWVWVCVYGENTYEYEYSMQAEKHAQIRVLPLSTPIRVGTCKTAATANLIIYHFVAAGQQQKII